MDNSQHSMGRWLKAKRVTLLGLGRSSVAAARLLQARGATPFVSDAGDGPHLTSYAKQLEQLDIAYETGGHSTGALQEADLVVLSPGVPAALPLLEPLRQAGIPVLGELELAARFYAGRILAITGTNGKTTTTRLLQHLLLQAGVGVALAGNNETPFSEVVLAQTAPEYVVLEVSSYQLETTDQFHPHAAAILNLTPDHLGRHGDMAGYAAAKQRIFLKQGPGDVAVLNYDDPRLRGMAEATSASVHYFSLLEPVPQGLWMDGVQIWEDSGAVYGPCDAVSLPGRHNLANALAAMTLMRACGFDREKVLAGLQSFTAVEHRIEPVTTFNGITFYNDSKSTNIDSLRVALESFTTPVVLIAGGQGKGSDYTILRDLLREKVAFLITIGDDASKLEAAFGDLLPFERAMNMEEAVAQAYAQAEKLTGTATSVVVLLSPGCASFDWYQNFEVRGEDFKNQVKQLIREEQRGVAKEI